MESPHAFRTFGGRQREAGISLPEVMVVLALMSVVSLMFYQLYVGTLKSTMFVESKNDLAMFSQQAVNRLKLELMQSRRIYQNDATGNSYLSAYQLPSDRPMLDGSRLPVADPNGAIEPDASGEIFTGNAVLAVREHAAHSAVVDHDADSSTADITSLADLYSFQLFYLAKRDDRALPPQRYYLDLYRLESQRYADYFQLQGLESAHRDAIAESLYAAGIRFAWEPNAAAPSAFYSIGSDGTLTAVSDHVIAPVDAQSLLPQLHGGRISGTMIYSVGIEGMTQQTPDEVSVLAQSSGVFPSGFEVKVIGPTGARKIFTRLVLVAQYQDQLTSRSNTVLVTIAEF
jgi:prepilin-type N-terminal cleavage/methylation domain-containing protein